jgi:cold shock protein
MISCWFDMKGKCKAWIPDRGFGFILSDNGDEVFCHFRDLQTFTQGLEIGTRVEFDVIPSDRKPGSLCAKNVRLLT